MTKLAQSYVHGACDLPLIGDTIGVHLDRMAGLSPDRPALVSCAQDIHWNYGEFRAQVDATAAGLIALGFQPGDRLGIWSPNNAEWVVTQFATAKAGIILVNINPAYRLHELEYALNKVGCAGLILAIRFKSSDYLAMIASLCPELAEAAPGGLRAARLPDLRWVFSLGDGSSPGMLNFADIAAAATPGSRRQLAELQNTLQFDDPINIQFTSGTTGSPKGATLTHHNILNNGFFIGEAMGLTERDRLCIPVPLYHCFGMVLGNLPASHTAPAWCCPARDSIRALC
jgi:fatty-acyl-CoA synthase